MRCKPGQLAMVIRSHQRTNIGTIVRTVRVKQHSSGVLGWVFEEASRPLKLPTSLGSLEGSSTAEYENRYNLFMTLRDDALMPLNDPDADIGIEEVTQAPKVVENESA